MDLEGMTMCRRSRGFTLPEILTVIVIVAVLAAILIPTISGMRRKAVRAACQYNLVQISQALIAYRQDHHVYPEPESPIGTLSASYAKLLPKIPTCPQDEDPTHDSYVALYNYWGYAPAPSPMPFVDRTTAIPLNGSSATAWETYTALTGSASPKRYYWRGAQDAAHPGTPDTDFPGLANPNAAATTIVTICPWHVGNNGGRYVILLLSGETLIGRPRTGDTEYWTLSQAR